MVNDLEQTNRNTKAQESEARNMISGNFWQHSTPRGDEPRGLQTAYSPAESGSSPANETLV